MADAGLPRKLAWKALSLLPRQVVEARKYRTWRKFLADSVHWSPDRIEAWQLARLRQTVRHAIENTEGYRDLFRKAGVSADDLRSTADIHFLPLSEKRMFQENLEAFSVQHVRRTYRTTGGTTGFPVGLYHVPGMLSIERAFVHDAWSGFGWKPSAPMAVLRGAYIGSKQQPWQWDPFRRELQLSSYFLTKETLPVYADAVARFGAETLQAFPSALHVFADLAQESGLAHRFPFRLILLASENFYDWQRVRTAEVFPQARLFDFYGQTERVIFAPWCEGKQEYHANPFYGVTEVVNGELIGTSFHSRGTPFIRYRILDRAVSGQASCDACGRNWRLLPKLLGRLHEQLVTGTGRYVSMSAMNMHDRVFDDLIQFQFMQEKAGAVSLRYLPRAPLTAAQENRVRRGVEAKLGSDMVLTLEPVTEIPRTRAGKMRLLDQRLPLRYGETEAADAA